MNGAEAGGASPPAPAALEGAGFPALAAVPEELWRRAAAAPERLLLLDYDGTLAPFAVDPAQAFLLPAVSRSLRRLADSVHTQVGIVSGRPLEGLLALLGPWHGPLVAEHGWTLRWPDGEIARHPLDPARETRLAEAADAAAREVAAVRVERKRTAVVAHTRGLPTAVARDAAAAVELRWRPATANGGLRLTEIDGGLELRATGHDKGTAVAELLARRPGATFAVYLGDDHTDEDAFAAVDGRGLGLRVGRGERPSRAVGTLPDCEAVAEFLAAWRVRVETEGEP